MASSVEGTFDPTKEPGEEDSGIMASHLYTRTFYVVDALNVEEFQERLEYKTSCSKSSFWKIAIQIEKDSPFEDFNLLATLKRVDVEEFVVEGILVIWLLNKEGKKCPVSYRLQCDNFASNVFDVDPHYKCLMPEDNDVTFPDDVLVVEAQLFVKGCCDQKYKEQCET